MANSNVWQPPMSRPAPVGLTRREESPMAPPRDVTRVADNVEGQRALQMGARVGYAVSGVLHLLIGWIALQVAWSASPKSADQSGALQLSLIHISEPTRLGMI